MNETCKELRRARNPYWIIRVVAVMVLFSIILIVSISADEIQLSRQSSKYGDDMIGVSFSKVTRNKELKAVFHREDAGSRLEMSFVEKLENDSLPFKPFMKAGAIVDSIIGYGTLYVGYGGEFTLIDKPDIKDTMKITAMIMKLKYSTMIENSLQYGNITHKASYIPEASIIKSDLSINVDNLSYSFIWECVEGKDNYRDVISMKFLL